MTEKQTGPDRPDEQAKSTGCGGNDPKYAQAAEKFDAITPMPKVDLMTFVLSLSSTALVHLGEVPEPESGRVATDLPMARHTIDVLSMLAEKTRGNTTDDECRLLKDVLFELRMKYVQKSR
jgi:hypothetical protein